MRLRRRKDKPEEGAEPVVRDAEGDPVEDPTVSGILPPLDAGAQGPEAVLPPPPPPEPGEAVPEVPLEPAPVPAVPEPEPLAAEEPATFVAEPEPEAEVPEPTPEPAPVPEPEPEPEPEPVPEPIPLPTPEPAPEQPEPVAAAPEPESLGHEVAEPAPAGVAVRGRSVGRPELLVGAAFVGGVAVAIVLRRLGRR